MIPGRLDIEVWRGSDKSLRFKLQTQAEPPNGPLTPVPYDDVRMSVQHRGKEKFKLTLSGGEITTEVDEEDEYGAPVFIAKMTPKQTRSLPQFREGMPYVPAVYEIEVWAGGHETTYMWGEIKASGGANDDDEADEEQDEES